MLRRQQSVSFREGTDSAIARIRATSADRYSTDLPGGTAGTFGKFATRATLKADWKFRWTLPRCYSAPSSAVPNIKKSWSQLNSLISEIPRLFSSKPFRSPCRSSRNVALTNLRTPFIDPFLASTSTRSRQQPSVQGTTPETVFGTHRSPRQRGESQRDQRPEITNRPCNSISNVLGVYLGRRTCWPTSRHWTTDGDLADASSRCEHGRTRIDRRIHQNRSI